MGYDGVLADYDKIPVDHSTIPMNNTTKAHTTGALPFLCINLLRPPCWIQLPIMEDDLESLLWVFPWDAMHFPFGFNDTSKLDEESEMINAYRKGRRFLRCWRTNDLRMNRNRKEGFVNDLMEAKEYEFPPEFLGVAFNRALVDGYGELRQRRRARMDGDSSKRKWGPDYSHLTDFEVADQMLRDIAEISHTWSQGGRVETGG